MTRTLTILFAAALALAPLSAQARETVRGSQASEEQVTFAQRVGRDTDTLLGATRRVEITSYPEGQITTARGAEVQLLDKEGNPAATVERLEFRTPEAAARFFEEALNEVDSGAPLGLDLAGKWVVRVKGPGLSDPTFLESVLASAWKRGPKAGPREARILSVLDGKGVVFEDNGSNPTITGLFGNMTDARDRSERGLLVTGETLTDDTYTDMSGAEHYSLTTKDGIRKGWIATSDMSVMMPSYADTFLTMKPRSGMLTALGNLLSGN